MNEYTSTSRELAARLPAGDHRLDNAALREIYGIARVTQRTRHLIAAELERCGLQVIYDPSHEPLVVRKAEPQRAAGRSARPWWQRKGVIAAAAVALLLIVIGSLGDSDDDDGPGAPPTEQTTGEADGQDPPPTRARALKAVADDRYGVAMSIAAGLGADDRSYIARRISRRIARRVMYALDRGDRGRARLLLRQGRRFPSTSLSRAARSRYVVVQREAAERQQALEDAREARRQARAQARVEERARREAEAAAPDPPDAGGSSEPEGGSTSNWCGKRDGDGDGIYCEGE